MKKLAKIIRITTMPPIVATIFFLLIFFTTSNVFYCTNELVLTILFIAVVPAIIYPVCLTVPKLKIKGRQWRRKMAIYMSALSYFGLVIYLFIANGSQGLWIIALTYLFSGIGLLFLNIFKIKASGHACAIIGPICGSFYFLGVWGFVGMVIPIGVFWASVYLKSHTIKELLLGSLVSVLSFLFTLGILLFILV